MAIPHGDINLFRNVPLFEDYEHTIDFKNKEEQFRYLFGFRKHTLTNYSYIRKEREYIAVELSLTDLDDINYLSFRSTDGDRLYYAFVTDKVYVNQFTSHIFFQIDVIQTYMFDYEWRASYIQQGHTDRWTAEHKPIYSKTDEGLNYGSEYLVESAYRIQQSDRVKWALVCMKDYTPIISEGMAITRSVIYPMPSPYALFLIPIDMNNFGNSIDRFYCNNPDWKNGALDDTPIGNIGDWAKFTQAMIKGAIGEYIHSITILPYNPLIESEQDTGEDETVWDINFKSSIRLSTVSFQKVTTSADGTVIPAGSLEGNFLLICYIPDIGFNQLRALARTDWNKGISGSMPTETQWAEIKANPRKTKRDKRFESKLLCSPYRFNILTDWRNEPVIFKNEFLGSDKIEIDYSFAFTPTSPFRYWIKDYKKDPEGRNTCLSQSLALELPIISDAYYTYLLQNKNTIQANLTNSIINASAGVINGVIAGGGTGGIGGAVYGGISGAFSGALSVTAGIRSENAKQMDIDSRPDTIISSADGSFNILDKNADINFYRMRICCENEEIIAEIFNMSGYKINRVEVPNTRSRVRFNYIQTVGANIVGSFNQSDISKIKEIYNRGITIWHYSDTDFYPLDYSYENIEVNLL